MRARVEGRASRCSARPQSPCALITTVLPMPSSAAARRRSSFRRTTSAARSRKARPDRGSLSCKSEMTPSFQDDAAEAERVLGAWLGDALAGIGAVAVRLAHAPEGHRTYELAGHLRTPRSRAEKAEIGVYLTEAADLTPRRGAVRRLVAEQRQRRSSILGAGHLRRFTNTRATRGVERAPRLHDRARHASVGGSARRETRVGGECVGMSCLIRGNRSVTPR